MARPPRAPTGSTPTREAQSRGACKASSGNRRGSVILGSPVTSPERPRPPSPSFPLRPTGGLRGTLAGRGAGCSKRPAPPLSRDNAPAAACHAAQHHHDDDDDVVRRGSRGPGPAHQQLSRRKTTARAEGPLRRGPKRTLKLIYNHL
eukprot:scaffold4305_cov370-Prasinococcus_capsulatus_cf.AAC.2